MVLKQDSKQKAAAATTPVEDFIAAVLGLAIVVALYTDGRAHVLELPDSFFTPWHAFLYGGLLVLTLWLAVISRRAATRGGAHRWGRVPDGYAFAVTGAGLFAAGGLADLIWHEVFGVEAGLDALLSPSHLWLFVAGSLLMSGPIVAAQRRAGPPAPLTAWSVTLAVTSIAAIAAFALSFYSGFVTDASNFATGGAAQSAGGSRAVVGLGSYLLTSMVLVLPLAYLVRARLARAGAVTVLVSTVAVMASMLEDFHDVRIIPAAAAAAVLVDAVLAVLRRRGAAGRVQEIVLAALLPLLLWPGQLFVKNLGQPVQWSAELVYGIVVLSALLSVAAILALGAQENPVRSPQGPPDRLSKPPT